MRESFDALHESDSTSAAFQLPKPYPMPGRHLSLVCPNCAKEDVLIDNLVADNNIVKSLREHNIKKADKDIVAKVVVLTDKISSLIIATNTASPSVANNDTTASAIVVNSNFVQNVIPCDMKTITR